MYQLLWSWNPFRILRSPLLQGTYHTLHSSSKRAGYQGLSRFLILPAKIRRLESILSDSTRSPSAEFHSTVFHFYRVSHREYFREIFHSLICDRGQALLYPLANGIENAFITDISFGYISSIGYEKALVCRR